MTSMPVTAMAYLDTPEEAGYFIFPDLLTASPEINDF